jgi:SAM-dependent methyltransferase
MRRVRRFDQGRHWRERGVGYAAEFERHSPETAQAFAEQEEAIRGLLRETRFADVRSVLEVGVGFGRVTALVLEGLPAVERYVALDISPDQIAAARARLSERKLRPPEFVVGNFRDHPESDSFDLVLAAEVFLHFPPAEATDVVRKAQRLSRRFLVHVDRSPRLVGRPCSSEPCIERSACAVPRRLARTGHTTSHAFMTTDCCVRRRSGRSPAGSSTCSWWNATAESAHAPQHELVASQPAAAGSHALELEARLAVEIEDLLWFGDLERVAPDPVHEVVPPAHATRRLVPRPRPYVVLWAAARGLRCQ